MKSPINFLGGIAGAMTGSGGNSGKANPGGINMARMLGQDYKSENFNYNRQLPGAIDHTTGMVNTQTDSSGMGIYNNLNGPSSLNQPTGEMPSQPMQSGEMELNPYTNQNTLGALGPKIPSIAGQNIPGTTSNIMSQTGARGPLGMHTSEHKKNEINVRASQSTQKSETDANKSTSSLSGGIDYKRGNLGLNASGDTNKNYNFGLSLSNKKGNVSGGVKYNTGQFGNVVSGNIKLKW